MKEYLHKIQYYETDMMGIVHHSNYIRWMEEARIDYLEQLGFSYSEMEQKGVLSPVTAVSCEYKRPCTFGEEISISVSVDAFNSVILKLAYEMKNQKEETVCKGKSEHVFMDKEGHFVRMKREMPEFCAAVEAVQLGGK